MLGLINRAIEDFLKSRYGEALWLRVVRSASLSCESFEPLLRYDPALTERVLQAACLELGRSRDTVLEDMGTALVAHQDRDGLRRLLRFGGVTFRDFLHSLEEVPDRARLALPDLHLPEIRLQDCGAGRFLLTTAPLFPGAGFVMIGLLRAMADDYGALVLLEMATAGTGADVIEIRVLDDAHSTGRRFDLTVAVS